MLGYYGMTHLNNICSSTVYGAGIWSSKVMEALFTKDKYTKLNGKSSIEKFNVSDQKETHQFAVWVERGVTSLGWLLTGGLFMTFNHI